MKRPTIADVAVRAGVSEATVSRVLNKPEIVKPDLQKRVNRAMAALKYQPNRHARALGGIESKTVGIMIFNEVSDFFESPFWRRAISAIYDQLIEVDLQSSFIFQRDLVPGIGLLVDEKQYLNFLNSRHSDSLIIMGFPPPSILKIINQTRIPVLLWGRLDEKLANITYIESDNFSGGGLAAEHFITAKKKNLAIIAAREDAIGPSDRMRGFIDTIKKSHLPWDRRLMAHGNLDFKSGREAMTTLLARNIKIDAVFAVNDQMALGALDVLDERGIKVPNEISILGFDNSYPEDPEHQRLSTIAIDFDKIAHALVDSTIDRMQGKTAKSRLIPVELIIRKTS